MTTGVLMGGPPRKCFRPGPDGGMPTCTKTQDGQWHVTYDSAFVDAGTGVGGGFAVLFVLVLLGGLAVTVWRVTTARRMAREAGMNERDAGTMALVSDDGFEATYLAASLRQPPAAPATPEPPVTTEPPAPVSRAAADRLRELDELLSQGLIDQEEYDATRQAILGSL